MINRQTHGDEVRPFKSLYLAVQLPIPQEAIIEIISFLDSVIHFPQKIANHQHKHMKVAYVQIYAQMIKKLGKNQDERVKQISIVILT